MAKFLMLGKYSLEGVKGITGERTKNAASIIEKSGGKVELMYALLGKYDLVFIVDFPGVKEALKASVLLAKATGITFTSSPAVTVEEFDKIVA